jgi:glucan 1,3-beta-glucosidase
VIDADPYLAGGAQWYTNQNNFYRSVRNFVIDLRQGPSAGATALHWQVSQGMPYTKAVNGSD